MGKKKGGRPRAGSREQAAGDAAAAKGDVEESEPVAAQAAAEAPAAASPSRLEASSTSPFAVEASAVGSSPFTGASGSPIAASRFSELSPQSSPVNVAVAAVEGAYSSVRDFVATSVTSRFLSQTITSNTVTTSNSTTTNKAGGGSAFASPASPPVVQRSNYASPASVLSDKSWMASDCDTEIYGTGPLTPTGRGRDWFDFGDYSTLSRNIEVDM